LREFLKNARKYSSLISDDKYELESRKPFDLVIHIKSMVNFTFPKIIGTVKDYQPSMDKGNGRQVFEFVFSKTDNERLDTYVNVFSRLKKCTLPQSKNLFFIYYAAQSLENNLTSVRNNMLTFLKYLGKDSTYYEDIYNDVITFLEHVYRKKIETTKEKDIDYADDVAGHFNDFIQAPYTEETFLDPQKILVLLNDQPIDFPEDLSDYKEIIEIILLSKGTYKLKDTDHKDYLIIFEKLLAKSSLKMKNNSANRKTLTLLAKKIYEEDKTKLEFKLSQTETSCSYADTYIELYKKCIK
jgi:hypothetical protein